MSYFEGASNEPTVPTHAPAGYGKRVQAAIVDFLIVVAVGIVPIVVFIIGVAAAIDASDKGEPAAGGTMMLLGGLTGLVWFAWQVWLFGYRQGASGTTPGKRMAGIRLTRIGTGVEPGGSWYRELGSGMGPTLNTAAGMDAYVMSDRATWVAFENRQNLELLFSGDKVLFNQYGSLLLSEEKHPHLKHDLAAKWHNWLLSEEGQQAIADFKVDGQQLFFPNAQ